jgi:hypothetical protein
MTTYYPDSKDITQEEIGAVSKWMEEKKLLIVRFFSYFCIFQDAMLLSTRFPAS